MKIIFPRIETLQFHDSYDGGSKFIHYLSQELAKKGIDVEIVTSVLKDKVMRKKKVDGVTYTFIPPRYVGRKRLLNLPYKLMFSYNLMKYLNKIDFDILHSTEMFSYFYLHKKKRKPVIFQCWALEAWPVSKELEPKGIKKIYNKFFLRPLWQYCISHSDSIAADGDHQLQRLKKIGVPREKIWFIPNGVAFKKIQDYKKNLENIRKNLGINKKDLVILSVCQIAPGKGIDTIINSFSLVKKQIPNARLILIGKGVLEPLMHELFKERNLTEEKDVFHRKNIPEKELYNYFFSSDIFVSAALSEDFLISIQEAMACGLPIISSAQPFLVKNGVNGHVVGFDNPTGIKKEIVKIYKRRCMKKMGVTSRKMAKMYDYSIIVKNAINEYGGLCDKQTG